MPIEFDVKKVYTLDEVTKITGVDLEILKQDIKEGKLKAVQRGDKLFIKGWDIDKYIRGREKSNKQPRSDFEEEFRRDLEEF